MNLFKVFASGRKKFSEEVASAFLAWLLNPHMEHGLGYTVLEKFLKQIIEQVDAPRKEDLEALREKMVLRLRSSSMDDLEFRCHLEKRVDDIIRSKENFIDIVIQLDNWWIAIENKLYEGSVTPEQFRTQYLGLRKDLNDPTQNIIAVYLVPSAACGEKEFSALTDEQLEGKDFKVLSTWKHEDAHSGPSIEDLIRNLLKQEQRAELEPFSEYLRHTLRSLCVFIDSEFKGYAYDSEAGSSGLNPATEKMLNLAQLRSMNDGYVGASDGIAGLIRRRETLEKREFQYTHSEDVSNRPNWLPIEQFRRVTDWLTRGVKSDIEWPDKMNALCLLEVAKDYPDVFIGIKGGKTALEKMDAETLKGKRWSISKSQLTKQYVPAREFVEILEKELRKERDCN